MWTLSTIFRAIFGALFGVLFSISQETLVAVDARRTYEPPLVRLRARPDEERAVARAAHR